MALGPSLYTPAGWQGKWEDPGQVGREGAAKRVLEPLKLGQDRVERPGWGCRAGPSRLEEPVCSQMLASVLRGGANRLEYLEPSNSSQ